MSRGPVSSVPGPRRGGYKPGDVIGSKYRLQQMLGEGGMGSVWVAENVDLAANVALKLIRADAAEPSANERFLSEARVAAQLRHAAITRVFDTGKTSKHEPFIVMELLEGETLGQRLARRGSVDPIELVQMLLPIIDALHSAHGQGVIHRDLKPDNVFIARTENGIQPKLLDFGIAKLRGESAFKFSQTKLTQAGTLIGSPDYMSPEQAKGELDLDARSDIWALCVLAYECLVGRPPFQGDNYNALLWNIIHDEPIPITVFQAGDSELWRILKGGFAKDRKGRWESAKQFGEALAAWLESHGITEDICARSLHASWLPAERPTRPELAPFKEVASPARPSSQAPVVAPPTLPMLPRPSLNFGLWFAGAGFIALLAAILLSRRDGTQALPDAPSAVPPVMAPALPPAALPPAPLPQPGEPGHGAPSTAPAGVLPTLPELTVREAPAAPVVPANDSSGGTVGVSDGNTPAGARGSDDKAAATGKKKSPTKAASDGKSTGGKKPAGAARPTPHSSGTKSDDGEFDFGI
jgi:eukaryotic-like serine/threonine-protein kinase